MYIRLELTEFVWDKGNEEKSKKTHNVEWWECEEVFLNFPLFLFPDIKHPEREERFFAFGRSHANRLLTIVFTVRQKKIRVISARDMNKKERKVYHEETSKI